MPPEQAVSRALRRAAQHRGGLTAGLSTSNGHDPNGGGAAVHEFRAGQKGPVHGVAAPVLAVAPAATGGFARVATRYLAWLVVFDTLIAIGAFLAMDLVLRSAAPADAALTPLPGSPGLVWPLLVAANRGYRRSRIGVGTSERRAVLTAALWLSVLGAYPAAITGHHGWLLLVASATPIIVAGSLALRAVARWRLHALQKAGIGNRRTLVVGPADAVAELQERLSRETDSGMSVEAACLPGGRGAPAPGLGVPVLGDLHDVRRAVDAGGFEAVAVAGGECMHERYLRHLAWSLEGSDAELLIAPGLAEVVRPRLDIRPLVGVPLVQVRQPRFSGGQYVVKRGVDLVLTSVGLLVLAPLLAAVAIAIKLQDGGPVFFRQSRIGRGGESFELLKFRSMVVDAEARKAALMARNEGHGGLFKLADDPRVTPLGRFIREWSIDELPQLFNVLSGSMSLVGPRPHLASELAAMPADASRRSLVPPGLTGLWQISGRSDLAGGEGLRLDLRYVENWSVWLDLTIIAKTFGAVLKRSGAH